jgi:hypothetical protein
MRFARIVFICAGIWGLAVLTPFYWLVDVTGRHYPAPTEYPHFFYGFFAVALAWQIAFLAIGLNPVRLRALMILAMLEKFGFVATLIVLFSRGRIAAVDAQAAVPDALLGVLFVVSYWKTRASAFEHVDGSVSRRDTSASSSGAIGSTRSTAPAARA